MRTLRSKKRLKESEKEGLIKESLPFIKYTAYRLAWRLPPHLTVDDLISVGLVGLVEAFDKFEHGRAKFKTFAEMRIKGAMLDELRASDSVSRSMKKKMSAIHKANAKLECELGRTPDDDEVADFMDLPLDEYYRIVQTTCSASPVRLEELTSDTNLNVTDCLQDHNARSPLHLVEEQDTKQQIAAQIDKLSLKEKQVLSLYYWNELTMKEIGMVLKLTESRVCQIHSTALLRLRTKLNE